MTCYLLDTNIWSGYYNNDEKILGRISKLNADDKVFMSAVVLGEALYGGMVASEYDSDKYIKSIKAKSSPKIYDIDEHVAREYGKLRADLFNKYAPKEKRKKAMRPEELKDPVTSKELGIQENDLWLVAQAVCHNFVLVTRDKMIRIVSVVSKELKYETW